MCLLGVIVSLLDRTMVWLYLFGLLSWRRVWSPGGTLGGFFGGGRVSSGGRSI